MLLAALTLITVHMLDGREVVVNPMNLTTISRAREADDPKKTIAPGVNCVLHFTDGGYVATRETCATIIEWLVRAVPEDRIR